jgi:Putative zinc-finger
MPSNSQGVVNPSHLGKTLTSYCFGTLSDRDQEAVEEHLMACDVCWDEFQRLDAAVRTLRLDRAVGPASPPAEAISLLGLTGRLNRPFAGHKAFVVVAAILFAVVWTLGVWCELGYAYDRFGGLAWALSVPVSIWVVGSLLIALLFDVKATRIGATTGLLQSTTIMLLASGLLVSIVMFVMPTERTILASIETRTASSGYLKDVGFLFLPLLLFILPSFHAVIALQHELNAGRAHQVLTILSGGPERILPRGMLFLSTRALTMALAVYGTVRLVGTNYMLDALTPGRYAQLFTIVAYLNTGVSLVLATAALVWYAANLNELKREASALTRFETIESAKH